MSINQTITLSGQDDIAPDEIDFPENSFFYIGGKAPPNKVLGTQLDGTLDYLNNDFSANSIRADGTPITQRITCFTTEILVEGQMNFQSSNPILIEGEYHNDSHLGIKDDKMGWYLDNITPFKIELLDDDGNILTKVECMATDILLNGWCHFTSETPFKIDEDIGGPNKVLGIDGTGLMKWLDDVSPIIPTDSNLDINSLIVEGFVPNIASYGVIIKTGLRVDGLASFKGLLGVVIDEVLLVQKNIDCRASLQLHDNIYMTATSNISINGDMGTTKEVIGKDADNNLKWMDIDDIIPPITNSDLVINSLRVEGLIPSITGYGVEIEKGLDVKEDISCNGVINIGGSLSFPKSNTNISILGDNGSINEVIGKDANNNLKWIHIGSSGLADGLNIDGAKLDLGIIATNQDLIDLNNIKMNDAEPRFFVGADFGASSSPSVLGSRANSGLLEWMNLTGPSSNNPIFRAGVNINTADLLDGQISVDYFPTMAGIHLNGSGAGYSGAVIELNSNMGIRQGKIQCSPIEDVNTTPVAEWVEPIVNVFWSPTSGGLVIDLNKVINARSATDIVIANTMTTEDAGSIFYFLESSNSWNGARFLKQNITFPVGVVSPLEMYSNWTTIRTKPPDNAILVGSLNVVVGSQATADNTACIEMYESMNVIGFHIGSGLNASGVATGSTIPVSTMEIQLIYSGVVGSSGRPIIYCNATIYARKGYLKDHQSWSALLYDR